MSDGTEFQEIQKEPQESGELAEARQQLDRATIDPEAALEKVADIKTSEAIEAAVKETVEGAVPTADGGRETGDREVAADTAPEDGRPGTDSQLEAERAARAEFAQDTEAATREGTPVDLIDSFDMNSEEDIEKPGIPTHPANQETEAGQPTKAGSGSGEDITLEDESPPSPTDLPDSDLPLERTSPVDHVTDALETADDQVGDFRAPTKHPQQIEPLPDRDPSGESAQIPGDSLDLELSEEQERPSYDPDLEPEPVGEIGRAPSEESNPQSEAEEAAVGKTTFGEPAEDPARSYSGVEMTQGEVAQDSDWNEGSGTGEEMVLETDPALQEQAGLPKYLKDSSFQIADRLVDSAEGSGKLTLGDLVLSVLPWPYHQDLPAPSGEAAEDPLGMYFSLSTPADGRADQDATPETEEGQDAASDSFPLPHAIKIDLKSTSDQNDNSSDDNQTDNGEGTEESTVNESTEEHSLSEVHPPAPEGLTQNASEDASLANQEIQNQLQRQQQLMGMMSQISKLLHDTENAVIRNADDGSTQTDAGGSAEGEDAAAQAEGALQEIGNQAQLEMIDLQNALQRQQQSIQMMSSISKMLEDTAMSVIRNIGGDEGSTQDDSEQPGNSDQDQGTLLETHLADQSDMSDLSNLTVSLEDSMQKQGQFLMIISNILKNLDDVDQAIINNMKGAEEQEGEDLGSSGDALQQDLEAWEEQLSTIGDGAQLTEVDLSSFLDKQQSTIEMLSGMTKTLTDTTSVVAQKMGLTQPPTLEAISQETGTQGGSLQEELASEGSPADWQSIAIDNGIDDPRTGEPLIAIENQPEDTGEASSSSGSDQSSETDELRDRLSNLEATRHRLEMDINSLRDFIAHTPEGQFQILLIHLPVPDGQGGYHMVPMQVPADVNGAANLLAQQEGLLNQIMSEIAQVQNQLEAEPNGSPAQAENPNQEGGAGSNWQDAAQDSEVDDPRTGSGPFQSG